MKTIKKLYIKLLGIPVRGITGRVYNSLFQHRYMEKYVKYLKKCGVKINGYPSYIACDVYFDSHDYSLISIGNDVTISMGVTLLTHDYSIARGVEAVKGKIWENEPNKTPFFLKPIEIGDNCFIGAGSILLPGTKVGRDCIIGSHAVIKGVIPDNSIVVGNPGKIIEKTTDWAKRHMDVGDYYPLV